jgi:hypothetical protein
MPYRDRLAVGVERVLEDRSAVGLFSSISSAQRRSSARSSPPGTTAFTSPQRSMVRGVVLPAQVPDLAGALVAEDARQVGAAEAGVERADPRPGLPEAGVLGGDREVAHHVQHVAAADRDAVDRGDHRLRAVADQPVQRLDLEQAGLGGPVVAGLLALLLVAADAEGLVAGAGQRDHPHRRSAQAALKQRISSSTVRPRNALSRSGRSMVIQARPCSTS